MKRYLIDFNSNLCKHKYFDVIIIGAGIAGLYTALMLPQKLKIAVLSKKEIDDSDSYMAQGGIAASIDGDDRELHVKDTVNAGCYVNDKEAVEVLVNESEQAIENLIKLGVNFDRDSNGNFYRSFEGNHSIARILHVNGDSTGKGVMEVLIKQAERAGNIDIISGIFAVDIVENEGKYCGITALHRGEPVYLGSRCCVMASGGIGQLFSKTTNVDVLTGDGIAMAIRAGIGLKDMEYVQFHPTAFYSKNKDTEGRLFLISEAVRGEGAVLKNINGKRFMKEYDSRMELAPRDIVARAIFDQMKKTSSKYVYLDATMYDEKFLRNRFKQIYRECEDNSIEMYKDYIPVTPAEHYFMGGIKVDLFSRTCMDGLYAVGECACTGVHGANRLASNSLLEALVFGNRAAQDISEKISGGEKYGLPEVKTGINLKDGGQKLDFGELEKSLKDLMEKHAGIIRNIEDLKGILKVIEDALLKMEALDLKTVESIEAYNMYQVAGNIVISILNSKSSIGSNYVEDYSKAAR
ncbi:L-aspartate oxidase [uncultured Clostridium sp.]|jgi:L-aspartate oxidase|uniref:L-aspartate oxidase n=1 Tax=uncultured Clostridium sp. TaxID=59620 RepID=UPI0025EF1227|nr:L-aspartate oxidase [uncultured Clostridium sp.]NLU09038.1 L-aspartate oxidase [Clostridiales bacterium]